MELVLFIAFGITIIVVLISRYVYSVHQKRRILSWIPEVPGIPILGNVLQVGESTVLLKQFSKFLHQYSGLCRLNLVYSISLLTSDPKVVEFVLSSDKILDKSTGYKYLENWLGQGLLTATGVKWRKNRKIITPAFHFSILEQFVEVFERNGKIMIELLEKEVGKVINVFPFVNMCTLDAICEAAMGVSLHAQKNPHSEYAFSVKEMCRIIIERSFSVKRYDLLFALTKDWYTEKKCIKVLHGMTNSVIEFMKDTPPFHFLGSDNIGRTSTELNPIDISGMKAAMGVSLHAQKNPHSEYAFSVKEMCRIIIERSFSVKRYDLLFALTKDWYTEKKCIKVLHGMTNSVIESRKEELKREFEGREAFDTEKSANSVIESRKEELKREFEGREAFDTKQSAKKLAFLDLLLEAQMEGKDMPDDVIRDEVNTFMFEGHDTTTSAICFILYCLANNPEYQTIAFEEQKTLFGNDKNRTVAYRDLQEMKFLELVVKESLRLYPPIPFFARYFDQDVEYEAGHIIPRGVNIIIVAFEANRNPTVFENPEVFNPYRFVTTETKQWHYSYIPFSAGPRNCIGQKFAMLEMKSTVSKILRNFVIHSGGPENDVVLRAETVLSSKNGVNLKLTPRVW